MISILADDISGDRKISIKKRDKMSKQKNDKTMNMNFPSLTIPRVFITNSEEDESSTPTTLMER